MSLTVTADQVERARRGEIGPHEFFSTIVRSSLPDAYEIIMDLVNRVTVQGEGIAFHQPPHMSDEVRGQLLRMCASTSIRTALERHAGVHIAFQNCHFVGVADSAHIGSPEWQEFISIEGQVMAQSPELVDC